MSRRGRREVRDIIVAEGMVVFHEHGTARQTGRHKGAWACCCMRCAANLA
jgi:hypothetical protein